jgi:hypothetical protein
MIAPAALLTMAASCYSTSAHLASLTKELLIVPNVKYLAVALNKEMGPPEYYVMASYWTRVRAWCGRTCDLQPCGHRERLE